MFRDISRGNGEIVLTREVKDRPYLEVLREVASDLSAIEFSENIQLLRKGDGCPRMYCNVCYSAHNGDGYPNGNVRRFRRIRTLSDLMEDIGRAEDDLTISYFRDMGFGRINKVVSNGDGYASVTATLEGGCVSIVIKPKVDDEEGTAKINVGINALIEKGYVRG